MSWVRTYLLAGVAVGALAAVPVSAMASTTLTPGSGWVSDSVSAGTTPSAGSPFTFTITQDAYLSVTDAFTPGDVYQILNTVSNTVAGTTSFQKLPFQWTNTGGTYDQAWSATTGSGAATYSKISMLLTPGSYSYNVEDIAAHYGLPAGLGVRLDTASVPEPASFALLGVGLIGLSLVARRRQRA